MEKTQVQEKICKLAEDLFQKEIVNVDENANLYSYFEMTSIDVLQYLLSIENEFDFEFEDEYLNENILYEISSLTSYVMENVIVQNNS
ncbi:MAG: phosphopantetheine-binding protein [Lachnospiraceae bacterium]|nr:phosphopantetheine-binding protein [Lachnospiraceae bacterium]